MTRSRGGAATLACGLVLALAAGCAREEVTVFTIRNDCERPIAAAVAGDLATGSGSVVGVQPGSTRTYMIPTSQVYERVWLISVPEGEWLDRPLWTRKLTVPDGMRGGTGTRDDPYLVVVDGGLCVPGAPYDWELELER